MDLSQRIKLLRRFANGVSVALLRSAAQQSNVTDYWGQLLAAIAPSVAAVQAAERLMTPDPGQITAVNSPPRSAELPDVETESTMVLVHSSSLTRLQGEGQGKTRRESTFACSFFSALPFDTEDERSTSVSAVARSFSADLAAQALLRSLPWSGMARRSLHVDPAQEPPLATTERHLPPDWRPEQVFGTGIKGFFQSLPWADRPANPQSQVSTS